MVQNESFSDVREREVKSFFVKREKVHPDLELITHQEKIPEGTGINMLKYTLSKRQCPISPSEPEVFLFRKDCGVRKAALLIILHLFYCLVSISEIELQILEQGSFSLIPVGQCYCVSW